MQRLSLFPSTRNVMPTMRRVDAPLAAPPVVYAWWKWFLFGLCAAFLCVAACWTGGGLAGAEMLREMKQLVRDKREEKEAASRRNASLRSQGVTPVPVAASGEAETKAALERILGAPFVKVRPAWLRNTVHGTGRNLEIDCFNEELGIAVEFSGTQHFTFPNPFDHTLAAFTARLQRDAFKRQVCEARGLVFIVVPYTVPRKDIQAFLLQELAQRGLLSRSSTYKSTRTNG